MVRQRTIREMDVLQVAGIIYENLPLASANEIARRNKEAGWTYEVRYDRVYISENDYTLVEGRQLSAVDLEVAMRIADEWLSGEWANAESIPPYYFRNVENELFAAELFASD